MAQVKKYNLGGQAEKPTSKKYGTFTYDNTTYQVDDDFINQLSAYGSTLTGNAGNKFQYIIDAVKQGNDVSFNSAGDGQIIGNINFGLNDRQSKRLRQQQSGFNRMFGSGQVLATREAINALKGFHYSPKPKDITNYDYSKKYVLTYERDKDGNYIVDNNGNRKFIQTPDGLAALRRLENIPKIANYSDNDQFTGYNKHDKQYYLNLYNERSKNNTWNELAEKINKGTLTQNDLAVLREIGIITDAEEKQSNKSDSEKEDEKITQVLTDAGLDRNNAFLRNLQLTKNSDGTFSINNEAIKNELFGDKSRVHFNQYFLDGHNQYADLAGWWYDNGKLIPKKLAEDTNSWFYKNLGSFIARNRRNEFVHTDANGNIIYDSFYGLSDPFTTYESENYFVPGLKATPGMRFRTIQDPNNPNQVIYEYYDNASSSNHRDVFGYPTNDALKRVKYNKLTGEIITDNVEIPDSWNQTDNYIKLYSDNQYFKDNNLKYYPINIGDEKGNTFTLFVNPYNNNDVLYLDKNDNNKVKKISENGIKLLQDKKILSTLPNVYETSKNIGYISRKVINNIISDATEQNINNLVQSRQDLSNMSGYQGGGRITYNKVETKEIDTSKKAEKIGDPTKAATGKEVFSGDLTGADIAQLVSIGTDVAALVTAMATGGGNPVASAIGATGSLAQFGSDVARDGLDWGDAGNLLLNLGLDAASFFPIFGGAAKIAKTSKIIKNSVPLLKGALLAYAGGRGVSALMKIASDPKNSTLDDWKQLSMGLMSINGMRNMVKEYKMTNYKPKTQAPSKKDIDQAKREWLDKTVKEKKYHIVDDKGTIAENWYDKSTGKIKDYAKAEADLKANVPDFNMPTDKEFAKQVRIDNLKSWTDRNFTGKYNPLSDNFILNPNNRYLAEDFDINSLTSKSDQTTLKRLFMYNDAVKKQLTDKNYTLKWDIDKYHPWKSDYHFYPSEGTNASQIIFKQGGKILKGQDGLSNIYYGGSSDSSKFWDKFNQNGLFRAADYVASVVGNKRIKDLNDKAIESEAKAKQVTNVERNLPSYYQADIDRAYDAQKQQLLSNKFANSDARLSMAYKADNNQKLAAVDREKGYQESKRISDYRLADLDNMWFNKERAAKINDYNSGLINAMQARKYANKSNYEMQKTDSLKKLLYQFSQNYDLDLQERKQAKGLIDKARSQIAFDNEINQTFGSLFTDEMKKEYGTIDNFVASKFPDKYTALREKHFINLYIDQYNNNIAHSFFGRSKLSPYEIPYQMPERTANVTTINVKKGGILKFMGDTLLQRLAKGTLNKDVETLNENVIKLFSKIMS